MGGGPIRATWVMIAFRCCNGNENAWLVVVVVFMQFLNELSGRGKACLPMLQNPDFKNLVVVSM